MRTCSACGIRLTFGKADHVRRNGGYVCSACYNRQILGRSAEPLRQSISAIPVPVAPVAAAGSLEARVLKAAQVPSLRETKVVANKPEPKQKMYHPTAFEDGFEFEIVGNGIEDIL